MSADPEALSVVASIKDWLSFCRHEHEFCRRRQLAGLFQDTTKIYVVDVIEFRVVEASISTRYTALSYVWGHVPQLTATKANQTSFTSPGALLARMDQIPRVVKDAIKLTSDLGEKYLWVDSLCIVQDDVDRKHQQIAMMSEIYNRAIATFIACDGIDANAPLMPSNSNRSSILVPTRVGDDFTTMNVHLRHRFRHRIMQSVYSQRGWTYQERLLSRRRIMFLSDAVIFHCRMDVLSPVELRAPAGRLGYHTMSSARPPYCVHRDTADGNRRFDVASEMFVSRSDSQSSLDWPILTPSSWTEGFAFWVQLATDMSSKAFTYEVDVEPASASLLDAFSRLIRWPVHHGMPMPIIDLVLHWIPKSRMEAQVARPGASILPSWSWLAWKGGVDFSLVVKSLQQLKFHNLRGKLKVGSDQRWTNVNPNDIHITPESTLAGSSAKTSFSSSGALKLKGLVVKAINLDLLRRTQMETALTTNRVDRREEWRENWRGLQSTQAAHAGVCGVLFCNSDSVDMEWNNKENLSLILLSDIRYSSFSIVSSILAPEGVQAKEGPERTYQADEYFDYETKLAYHRPLGAIRNVMLIKRLERGWRADRFCRLAVGQIRGQVWDDMHPKERSIELI